ncbi:N-acetylmuramoyl-L-alanine amidase [Isoptericola sp. NEAU-Y5]|uniref:N-acetylmuramoyl-L-alanine amidase n=1 Tax=Isoptericola luteus TaxID=2879484 RepID=A0ABS7ZCI2_9MICO|nr:N-acetylmuramoyl-L-alanine amidase [Isoptericola sp. NEAU-Y5]MCA5892758.1 N-acetylmuramoyl-L-alanine amidase [Isoptericola sp. NEAU-Y5]
MRELTDMPGDTRGRPSAARLTVATTTVCALALAGVVVPTLSLPVPEAHAVSPDVEHVDVDGVDRAAEKQAGALDDAVGHEHVAPEEGDPSATTGQPADETNVEEHSEKDEGELAALSTRTATDEFLVAGVTWDAADATEVTEVAVRVREDGRWTPWQSLGIDGIGQGDLDTSSEEFADARAGTEPIVSTGADGVQVRVKTADGDSPAGLKVDLVDPGTSAADAHVGDDGLPAASANAGNGFEIKPRIVSRAGWGADESLSGSWPEYSKKLRAIYVHHTVGTNSYRESQSAALVRGIYAYHTRSRGWPDIGYQFLVDKYGNIFEGRKKSRYDNPVGAQAGGYNTGTIGISAMGNFETARPTSALLNAISKVVAWKAYQYHFNVKGSTTLVTGGSTGSGTRADPGEKVRVPRVLMHRTTNETACPGRYLAAKMGTIRNNAESRRRAAIDRYGPQVSPVDAPTRVSPTSAQAPVQWSGTTTYKWKPVRGASHYQVLYRRAFWNSDMPSTNNWRMMTSRTTRTSITVSTSSGWSREIAVRAVSKDSVRGPMRSVVRTSRPVHPNYWTFSSGWKKVTKGSYYGDRAYQTTRGGSYIRLGSANQVRRVVLRGPTNPVDGKLQVRVGGKAYKTLDFSQASAGNRKFTVTLPRSLDGTVTLRKVNDGKKVRISSIALTRW